MAKIIIAFIALSVLSATAIKRSQQVLQARDQVATGTVRSEENPCMDSMEKFMKKFHDAAETCEQPPELANAPFTCESGQAMMAGTEGEGPLTEECCAKTPYDAFLADVKEEDKTSVDMKNISANSVLYVIDMQNDFVGTKKGDGSFRLPCNSRAQTFATSVADFMTEFAAAGGQIMLSLDYHPVNHCSFEGTETCLNSDTPSAGGAGYSPNASRYNNQFPAHCTFECAKDGPCTPTDEGAKLHKTIRKAVDRIIAKAGNVKPVVVYKGFHESYDSFSAMPHNSSANPSDEETVRTGGWALGTAKTSDAAEIVDAPIMPDETHRPTKAEFEDPKGETSRMVSAADILKEWNTKDLYVVGLVYDCCVCETAMYAKNANPDMNVNVIGDLTRPAVDGKPNMLPPVLVTSTSSKAMSEEAWTNLWGSAPYDPQSDPTGSGDLGGNPISGAKQATVAHMEAVKAALKNAEVGFLFSKSI